LRSNGPRALPGWFSIDLDASSPALQIGIPDTDSDVLIELKSASKTISYPLC